MIIPMTEKKLPEHGYIFKHSTRCPISSRAAEEVKDHEWKSPVYWVNVIEERPMSDWVSKETGVTHQSPQLLFFKDGKVVKTLSHSDICEENFSGF